MVPPHGIVWVKTLQPSRVACSEMGGVVVVVVVLMAVEVVVVVVTSRR